MLMPKHGFSWFAFSAGALLLSGILLALMQLIPVSARRYVIRFLTFLAGLYYVLEFFLPVHSMPTKNDPHAVGNFLTPFLLPIGNYSPVIIAFTIGLGVVNLFQVHSRRLIRRDSETLFSVAFFVSFFAMLIIGLLDKAHPNSINKNLYHLLFDGFLQSLDATVFSIIAFYIVSAAYRAFRVKSIEATLLLVTAMIVMLGQIPVGTFLTHTLPEPFHVEVIRGWILRQANSAALRAIAFGLSIGGLAISLRIWLGLERGSYFEES